MFLSGDFSCSCAVLLLSENVSCATFTVVNNSTVAHERRGLWTRTTEGPRH